MALDTVLGVSVETLAEATNADLSDDVGESSGAVLARATTTSTSREGRTCRMYMCNERARVGARGAYI